MFSRRFVAPLLAVAAFVAPAVSVAPAAHAAQVPSAVITHSQVNGNDVYAPAVTIAKADTLLTIVNNTGSDVTYTLWRADGTPAATSRPLVLPTVQVLDLPASAPGTMFKVSQSAPSAPTGNQPGVGFAQVIVL